MDGKLKAQEPNTNLMATLWQPYGNLMIWLGKSYMAKLRNGSKIVWTYFWLKQKQ